jgi:hypothetical protein
MRASALAGAFALTAAGTPVAPAAPPAGTYRATVTISDLRRAGASPREASWVAGRWTLVLGKATWTLRQEDGTYGDALDRGVLAVDDAAVVTFTTRSVDGFRHGEFVGRYAVAVTPRTLRFGAAERPRNHDLAAVLTAKPWRRRG